MTVGRKTGAVLAALALLAAGCGHAAGPKSASTTSSTAGRSDGLGQVGEGPYPWAYPASGTVSSGSGRTAGGLACAPGVAQFPSAYADPCLARWAGDNGGATSNGVTATTIDLSRRVFIQTDDSQQLAAEAKAEGYASPAVTDQVMDVFLNYFNKVYELYGRKVVITPVPSVSNYRAEMLGDDNSAACTDAARISGSDHDFADIGIGDDFQPGGTPVFDQCAAQDHLVVLDSSGSVSESFLQSNDPYVWSVGQSCTGMALNEADAYSRLLVGHKAAYAGEKDLKGRVRKLAVYVTDLPSDVSCASQLVQTMETQYGVPASTFAPTVTYQPGTDTLEQSAESAVAQLKSEGVTSVIAACDPESFALLTRAAAVAHYHPEWLLDGVNGSDTDPVAQTYDQPEVTGHLFGLSPSLEPGDIFGPDSPAGRLYRSLTDHEIPAGTDGNYGVLVWIFDALQAAGPDLTPQNLARGVHGLPPLGAPSYSYGAWTLAQGPSGQAGAGQHSLVTDARFVFWDGTGISSLDGKLGTYASPFGGQRYQAGRWPDKLPPLFQGS